MTIQAALKSQYHGGMAMLRAALDSCPEGLWADDSYRNQSWQVIYHTLFYTDFYLSASEQAFVPWSHHRKGYWELGPAPDGTLRIPYSREELTAYWKDLESRIDLAVDSLDLNAPECGFPWYQMGKLEHQLVNIRHLQHHTGQLTERLRQSAQIGLKWHGKGQSS